MKMFNFALKTVIEAFVTMMIVLWMRLVNSIQLQLCICGDPISFLLSLAPRWLKPQECIVRKTNEFSFGTFLRSGKMCLDSEVLRTLSYQVPSQLTNIETLLQNILVMNE